MAAIGCDKPNGDLTLTDANTANARFIAPAVATSTPLVFRFTATDSRGSSTADTTVTVEPMRLDFAAVPKNLNDIVTVPAGYSVQVLYRMGDPINAATSAYANNGTDGGFAGRAGDQHDALYWYGLAAAGSTPLGRPAAARLGSRAERGRRGPARDRGDAASGSLTASDGRGSRWPPLTVERLQGSHPVGHSVAPHVRQLMQPVGHQVQQVS